MGRYLITREIARRVVIAIGAGLLALAQSPAAASPDSLVALASAKFPNLTHAERAMLSFIDIDSTESGDSAACGTSLNPDDPSNDPANAKEWGREREIRASMIQWLCTKRQAIEQVNPRGIRIVGARIVGPLDLSYVHVPFAIVMRRCVISERLKLVAVEISHLDLNGSYTGEIDATGINVHSDLNLGSGLHASGETVIEKARIDGDLFFHDAHLEHSTVEMTFWGRGLEMALDATNLSVTGDVILAGAESRGGVFLNSSAIAGNLFCFGGRFINPGKIALDANGANITSNVVLTPGVEADGLVVFHNAKVGGLFAAEGAKFLGKATDEHGLQAYSMSVGGVLVWTNVQLKNGASLDLTGASTAGLVDDEKSWPRPGKLQIDGFSYGGFYANSLSDARSRLRWLALQDGYHPQPYRQLAQVLRNRGDDDDAREVLIAQEKARYQGLPLAARVWGEFSKTTIAYGHRPLRAIVWSIAIVLFGWVMVLIGNRAGVMSPTWPENKPADVRKSYEELQPLLYSLDVFLPFVNLHQEHYWWPDATVLGECTVLGRRITVRGRMLRYYLWLQIIAGWLLSAIFIAGVTGLLRND